MFILFPNLDALLGTWILQRDSKYEERVIEENLVLEISNPKGEYTFRNKVGRMAERMQMNVEKSIP